MTLRLLGSTSGYSEIQAPAAAGDQTFTLAGTGGVLDRLERTGNILQVVNATYSTQTSSSTSTYADTGLTASITPSSSSNKVLVFANVTGLQKVGTDTWLRIKLLRNTTDLIVVEDGAGYNAANTNNWVGATSSCYLDSPATTSAVTYKLQFASANNSASVVVHSNSSVSTITLMEVAA
jgi:hypothetical protein